MITIDYFDKDCNPISCERMETKSEHEIKNIRICENGDGTDTVIISGDINEDGCKLVFKIPSVNSVKLNAIEVSEFSVKD